MGYANKAALKLPDQLLVRYYRRGEIETVTKVIVKGEAVTVQVGKRTDRWRDLGGGLGFVPADGVKPGDA